MPVDLPIGWVVFLNLTGWPAIQLGLAWLFTRMPAVWFDSRKSTAAWETGGRIYERVFGIKIWKNWLPDGARWFEAGFAKGHLAEGDPDYLRRFAAETWRGELCHWFALGCTPVFFLWNPWWGNLVMTGYALAANVPCILAQRYNRARLARLLTRKSKIDRVRA